MTSLANLQIPELSGVDVQNKGWVFLFSSNLEPGFNLSCIAYLEWILLNEIFAYLDESCNLEIENLNKFL